MRANCVICMQLQLPLQNSNARCRPCSVKLNIELYYKRNCAPRCHILAKLKPYPDYYQALNVILHRCAVSNDCQQCLRRIDLRYTVTTIDGLRISDHIVLNTLAGKVTVDVWWPQTWVDLIMCIQGFNAAL